MSANGASNAISMLLRAPWRWRRETSSSHADGPRARSRRSNTVPPRMIASRADGGEARRRQERVGGRQPGAAWVDDHGDVAGHDVEALLEPQPQVLEAVEDALGARIVDVFVPGGEAQRLGLNPGHRARLDEQVG